ncbi:hypothetical protein MMD55_003912, partial [Acinetobacter baumannii]
LISRGYSRKELNELTQKPSIH